MLVIFLSFLLLVTCSTTVLLGFVAIKFGKTLLQVESTMNDALDKLDKEYQEIGEVLKQPLSSGDPSVTRVHAAIKRCQNTILEIANVLSSNWNNRENSEKSFAENEIEN